MDLETKADCQFKALLKFEDIYNPMKPYALLRKMGIPKSDAELLMQQYEQTFYNRALYLYDINKIEKEKVKE